jgi:hypothetical protein
MNPGLSQVHVYLSHDSILFHDHQGHTIEILETLSNGQERVLQTKSDLVRPIVALHTDEALQ